MKIYSSSKQKWTLLSPTECDVIKIMRIIFQITYKIKCSAATELSFFAKLNVPFYATDVNWGSEVGFIIIFGVKYFRSRFV